ncbi:periplasmic heavy metal sensor [uncultured Shimia sp.]|uniref:periplasmic heavy metal sensor n=1 Tax=uncultured Shimia sp. TaxID=573152 RepID=UPI00260B0B22|nr:periplasmic heavy metal sensor [uncultured Shimia sp.]
MREDTKTKPGMKRWLRVVFTLSLALNLVIVGLIGGAALKFGRSGPPPHVMDRMSMPILGALEHQDRREIGRNIRKAYRNDGKSAKPETASYETLIAVLEAEPLDVEALRVANQGLTDRVSQRMRIAQEAWLDYVQTMTPEARVAYAARMREMVKDPKSWRKHKRPSKQP